MSTRHRKVIISVVILTVLASLIGYIIFVPPYPLSLRLQIACRGLRQPIMELKPAVEPPQGPVINFPDPHLEAAIRHALQEPDRDIHRSDLERFIGLEDIPVGITILERLFGFNPRPGRISNLAGLEYASNLERLRITGNQIRDISPLANLTNLRELSLSTNRIRDITPLVNLTNLTMLSLGGNQISDISPLSNLHNLSVLYLSRNPLTDIGPLSNLINLEELRIRGNQISDISPLLQNEGLGDEPEVDTVWLTDNPLSPDSINIYIPELRRRGVTVHIVEP